MKLGLSLSQNLFKKEEKKRWDFDLLKDNGRAGSIGDAIDAIA